MRESLWAGPRAVTAKRCCFKGAPVDAASLMPPSAVSALCGCGCATQRDKPRPAARPQACVIPPQRRGDHVCDANGVSSKGPSRKGPYGYAALAHGGTHPYAPR